MHKNMGSVDRIVRIVVGIGVLSTIFVGPQTLWGLIGIVPLFTGAMNWCPLYTMLGVNTAAK